MRVTTEENLLEGAIESLTEILKKHPNYADVWNRLGLCFYLRKDYKEARRCFENGLKINSNYADCAVNYAYTLWQMGDVKNGIRRLLKIYGRTQKASIGNTLGRIFVSLGDFRKGIEYLAKSSQARRPLLYKLDFYFAHLLSDDRKKEFKREIRKIVRAEPSYKRFIKTQGLLETRGIHKSKILQMFNTNPNLHLVYVEMANLSASEGDMQRAKKLFLKAETILPDSAHAEYALGQIHFGRNESAAAKRHFRKAIKYDPHFTKSYISLSYIYTSEGDIKRATSYLEKALEAGASYPDLHYQLGNHLLQCGRYEEARRHLEKSLVLKPNYPLAQYALATCLFHLGEYERVLKIYEELESVALDFPDIHAQKAASYLLLGRPIDALTASMLLLPKEKRSTFRLYFAQALIHIGDKKNAKTVIEGLFKENPCPSLARRARLLLHHLVSK